jgi:serine protease AprX
VQDARLIRRRRVVLAALAGAVLALLAAAQPVTGSQPALADIVHANLEAKLGALDSGEPTEVIVQLEEPPTPDRIAALERDVGDLEITRRFSVVDGFAASATRRQIEALTRARGVVQVEANAVVRGTNDEAQASFGVSKARLDLPSLDGAGTTIAVLDSGVRADHLDLNQGKVVAFKDFTSVATTPYDDNGHGTHVAATIAGDGDARADRLYQGVAPRAALVGVKALDANGSGSMATITAAIDWVVQVKDLYGIEALNLSLGAAGCSDGTDATSQAVNRAAAAGLVVAVAAGNEGPGTCTIGAPGAAAGALTVGAMADTAAGGFRQASFSSRGPTADGRVKPDVSAPGVAVTSALTGTTTGYVTQNGTSMATPFVAGVALLMRDANPGLTPDGVKAAVTATAIDWARGGDNRTAGSTGPDIDSGHGRLDAYAALKAAGAALATGPAAPAHVLREGSLSGTGTYADHRLDVTALGSPLAATLIHPTISASAAWTPDFDLYLYDPAGRLVARAETASRQEDVAFAPTATGTYTLRVASYSGSGPYFVDVSGASAAAAAPAPTTTTANPSSAVVYYGSVRSGDVTRLRANDDAYFQVNSTTSGTRAADWYANVTGVSNALVGLRIAYQGKSSTTCTQTVYAYNYTSGVWATLDTRSVGTSEIAVSAAPGGTLADYVSGASGDGTVSVRVRCARTDGTAFFVSGDLLTVTSTRP